MEVSEYNMLPNVIWPNYLYGNYGHGHIISEIVNATDDEILSRL